MNSSNELFGKGTRTTGNLNTLSDGVSAPEEAERRRHAQGQVRNMCQSPSTGMCATNDHDNTPNSASDNGSCSKEVLQAAPLASRLGVTISPIAATAQSFSMVHVEASSGGGAKGAAAAASTQAGANSSTSTSSHQRASSSLFAASSPTSFRLSTPLFGNRKRQTVSPPPAALLTAANQPICLQQRQQEATALATGNASPAPKDSSQQQSRTMHRHHHHVDASSPSPSASPTVTTSRKNNSNQNFNYIGNSKFDSNNNDNVVKVHEGATSCNVNSMHGYAGPASNSAADQLPIRSSPLPAEAPGSVLSGQKPSSFSATGSVPSSQAHPHAQKHQHHNYNRHQNLSSPRQMAQQQQQSHQQQQQLSGLPSSPSDSTARSEVHVGGQRALGSDVRSPLPGVSPLTSSTLHFCPQNDAYDNKEVSPTHVIGANPLLKPSLSSSPTLLLSSASQQQHPTVTIGRERGAYGSNSSGRKGGSNSPHADAPSSAVVSPSTTSHAAGNDGCGDSSPLSPLPASSTAAAARSSMNPS